MLKLKDQRIVIEKKMYCLTFAAEKISEFSFVLSYLSHFQKIFILHLFIFFFDKQIPNYRNS